MFIFMPTFWKQQCKPRNNILISQKQDLQPKYENFIPSFNLIGMT